MAQIKTSKQFAINWLDIAKASLMAALTPMLVLIQNSLDAGIFVFNWKALTMAAIGGFVAYLLKNFFTPSKIILKGEDVDKAVEDIK
ncbi:MAG: hypothetical protein V4538_15650 [Bacteroidota bacterium]